MGRDYQCEPMEEISKAEVNSRKRMVPKPNSMANVKRPPVEELMRDSSNALGAILEKARMVHSSLLAPRPSKMGYNGERESMPPVYEMLREQHDYMSEINDLMTDICEFLGV